MVLNDAGRMVLTVRHELPENYPGVDIDALQVMPNHIRGIVVVVGAGPCACPAGASQKANNWQQRLAGEAYRTWGESRTGQPQGVAPTVPLRDLVHGLKIICGWREKTQLDPISEQIMAT